VFYKRIYLYTESGRMEFPKNMMPRRLQIAKWWKLRYWNDLQGIHNKTTCLYEPAGVHHHHLSIRYLVSLFERNERMELIFDDEDDSWDAVGVGNQKAYGRVLGVSLFGTLWRVWAYYFIVGFVPWNKHAEPLLHTVQKYQINCLSLCLLSCYLGFIK